MPPEFYEAFGSHEKPSGSFKSSFDRGVIFEDDLKWRDQHGRMEQPRPLVDTDELRERVRRETEVAIIINPKLTKFSCTGHCI